MDSTKYCFTDNILIKYQIVSLLDSIRKFVETYLDEISSCMGQINRNYWILFPDFLYSPYIIRVRKCSNGVAILFKRPAHKTSITVKKSRKRVEEIFLPYLPPPNHAIFAFTNTSRSKIVQAKMTNWDFSQDPTKGKMFQRYNEDFHRMSVMHLSKSNEVQMLFCPISGVNDFGRVRLFIRFLWMITGDCLDFSEDKARWFARKDFLYYLNQILFVWSPSKLSETAKKFLINMVSDIKNKYQELISRTDVDEQEIQDFLEVHRFILDPNAQQVWFKESLGKKNEADFIIGYGHSIRVVEIKRPYDRIFDNNMQFSATTRKALSEISRYRKWLTSNKLTTKGRYGSVVLRKGWAIIGNAIDMSERELKRLSSWNSTKKIIMLMNFNDLLSNFDNRIKQIKKIKN